MKKVYLLFISLLLSWGITAQISIQGFPRNDLNQEQTGTLKSAKKLKSAADETFSFDDIEYWVGEGSNKAALVVQWNDGKTQDALVWGYKWDGDAYGIDMINAIAKADPRFYILEYYTGAGLGSAIGGFGFDLDQKNTIALILSGDTTYPDYPVDGIVATYSYNFDNWTSSDTNDHWQSGWNSAYWSYWVKEEGGSFGYSGLGASSRKLKDGSWDAWSFAPGLVSQPLSETFTGVSTYQETEYDYTKGIFFVNEDWFGHADGSVNFLTENGDFIYNAYRKENDGHTLGVTTQYGTIYGDNFYLVSKQKGTEAKKGGRLVIADAKTLKKKASFDDIGGGDGRTFIGVDENTGYIGTSKGIYLFDIKNLTVGNLIEGTGGNNYQIGNMIRTSKYVFATKQSTGVFVIDPISHTIIQTIANTSVNTITQSKDGNVWIGAGSKLIKVNPLTLETEEITVSASISGSWGAWNAGGFCSSTQNNVLYWTSGGGFIGGGNTVIKYDIDTDTLNTSFYQIPGQEGSYNQVFYGAGLRIDPVTDNLVITTTENGYGSHYQKNWVHIVTNEGVLSNTYQLNDYYWFTALPVFPDNSTPKLSETASTKLASSIDINSVTDIDLKDKVTDDDNFALAIVKSLKETDNDGVISAVIDEQDRLVITPVKVGTAILEIIFNSNGKIVKHELTVNVTSLMGTDDIKTTLSLQLYPNPFTEYFFVEADKASTLSIYSVTGAKVHEQALSNGKNRINVPNLNSGIYIIKVDNKTYKIIKR
ncbi:MAG: DUF5074 domain-containing protein [Flavobacteriaceae bacterium]|jgi:hypothetical protein|nr:DUF5074 domain-containing protein [Flavobacteriaceae bacterium]